MFNFIKVMTLCSSVTMFSLIKSLEPRLKFWQDELACIKTRSWSWTSITIHFRPPSLFPSSLSLYIRVQGKANVSLKTNCTGRSNLARFQKLVGRGTWLDPTLIKVWLLEQTNTFPFSFESKLIQLFSSCP